MINYIKQRTETDCVIACLAMVTNQTYEEVMEDVEPYWVANNGEGIGNDLFYEYLAEKGYCVATYSKKNFCKMQDRSVWPPAPFAPIHVVGVLFEEYHGVVMDWRGVIYDPYDLSVNSLDEFDEVYEIVGIWKQPKSEDVWKTINLS